MITPEDCDRITLEDILRPDKRLISGKINACFYCLPKFLSDDVLYRSPF